MGPMDRLLDLLMGDSEVPYVIDTWGNVIEDPVLVAEAVDLLTRSLARPANTGSVEVTSLAISCTDAMRRVTRRTQTVLNRFRERYGIVSPSLNADDLSLVLGQGAPDPESWGDHGVQRFVSTGRRLRTHDLRISQWFDHRDRAIARGRPDLQLRLDPAVVIRRMVPLEATRTINRSEADTAEVMASLIPPGWSDARTALTKWSHNQAIVRGSMQQEVEAGNLWSLNDESPSGGRYGYEMEVLTDPYARFAMRLARIESAIPGGRMSDFDLSGEGSDDRLRLGKAVAAMMNGEPQQLEAMVAPVARRLLNGPGRFGIRFTPDMGTVEFQPDAMDQLRSMAEPLRARWLVKYNDPLPGPQGLPTLDIVNLVDMPQDPYDGITLLAFEKPRLAYRRLVEDLLAMRRALPDWWEDNFLFDPEDIPMGTTLMTMLSDRLDRYLVDDGAPEPDIMPIQYDLLNDEWVGFRIR